MSAGLTVSPEAKTAYDELKNEKKYRYIIYEIKDYRVVEVDTTGDYSATYADFLEQLQNYETECRYCVVNFPVSTSAEVAPTDRVVFITWCPEQAGLRQRMVYDSSMDTVRRSFAGVARQVEASKLEDVSQEAIEDLFQ